MNTSSMIHQEADLIAQLNPIVAPLRVDGVDIHNGYVKIHLGNGVFRTFLFEDPVRLVHEVREWVTEFHPNRPRQRTT